MNTLEMLWMETQTLGVDTFPVEKRNDNKQKKNSNGPQLYSLSKDRLLA
jgi:hypothetical protein